MAVPPKYLKPDSWPHLFAPVIGPNGDAVEKPFMSPKGPALMKLYKCTHCFMTWWQNKDLRPTGACPKRVDLTEQRRLRGMI